MALKFIRGLAVRKKDKADILITLYSATYSGYKSTSRNLLIYRYMPRGFLLRRPEDGNESILHWSRTVVRNYSVSSFL